MDTLSILREKAARLALLLPKSGVQSVVRHIELAERHFDAARRDVESDLFVDVIYRTNHAFEGILREAFAILAGQDSAGKSANEIEKYLSSSGVFQERVTELFANYRSKWRNPSTHDHVAVFSESEGFMAILSVTSFIGILMDQMIARLAFDNEQRQLANRINRLREMMAQHGSEPLMDRATILLQTFANERNAAGSDTEVEIVAAMCGFLTLAAPNISVTVEPVFRYGTDTLRSDLLLQDAKESVVVELKRYRRWSEEDQRAAFERVRRYVDAAEADGGILVLLPSKDAEKSKETFNQVLGQIVDGGKMVVTIRMLAAQ